MLRDLSHVCLFAIVLFLTNISIFGWDETGHKISAYIAWQRMTPEVRERVHKILLAGPEDAQIGSYYMTYGTRSEEIRKREFFMFMATWADVIRDRNFKARYTNYHHSNWHYDDKFWRVTGGTIEYLPAPEDGGKALERLNAYDAVIRGTAKDADKAIAIAWLQHLIGDIHQPLHTSARVTETEPKGDQGGNLFHLTPQGTPRDKQENLHWFWDSIVMRNFPNTSNACDAEYIEPLAERFMKKHPYAKMSAHLLPGKYEEWVAQSLKLAQEEVFSPDLKRWETPTQKYKEKALRVAEERLALAGYKMGDLFNQAFTAPTVAAPAD